MKKSIYFVILCTFGALLLPGCSMMPDDEDIINGSVLENEIFGNNLDDEIIEGIDAEDEIENTDTGNEDNNIEEVDEPVKVEIQQAE